MHNYKPILLIIVERIILDSQITNSVGWLVEVTMSVRKGLL